MSDARQVDYKDKYRLKPTALNALVEKLVYSLDESAVCNLLPVGDRGATIQYHALKRHGVDFYVFNMAKDSDNPDVEPDLLSIADVIQVFSEHKQLSDQAASQVLLIPMRMCRGYFKLLPDRLPSSLHVRRKHAVLVELDLTAKTVHVHDSQGVMRWLAYPDINDKLTGDAVKQSQYHAYGRQGGWFSSDVVSCGYFVYEYLKHILKTGSSAGCEDISVNIMNQCESMQDYLRQEDIHLNTVTEHENEDYGIETFEISDLTDEQDDDLNKLTNDGWVCLEPDKEDVSEQAPAPMGWLTSIAEWLLRIPTGSYASIKSFSLFSSVQTATVTGSDPTSRLPIVFRR